MLFETPLRFHGCSTGCVLPATSVARHHSSNAPGSAASHANVQGTQAYGEAGWPTSASTQVLPPSELTSTR